jgi:hypothetical protein
MSQTPGYPSPQPQVFLDQQSGVEKTQAMNAEEAGAAYYMRFERQPEKELAESEFEAAATDAPGYEPGVAHTSVLGTASLPRPAADRVVEAQQDKVESLTYDQKLDEVLKTVDLAIDIHSIRDFPFGWLIAGRLADTMKQGDAGAIRGRVLSIIGEFKVGKTWLQHKILDAESIDSAELHTPGICMRYVSNPNKSAARTLRPGAASGGPGGTSKRALGRAGAAKARVPPCTPNRQEPEYDYIILDSAGTEAACSGRDTTIHSLCPLL